MSESVKKSNRRRAETVKLHAKNTKNRNNDIKSLKSMYLTEKDSLVIMDILAKGNEFIKYFNKIAQDGVGSHKTGHKLTDGSDEFEVTYLSNNQRAAYLDKSAGLQTLIDYIERMSQLPENAVKTVR